MTLPFRKGGNSLYFRFAEVVTPVLYRVSADMEHSPCPVGCVWAVPGKCLEMKVPGVEGRSIRSEGPFFPMAWEENFEGSDLRLCMEFNSCSWLVLQGNSKRVIKTTSHKVGETS